MKKLTYLTGTLVAYKRLQNSADGNPKWKFILDLSEGGTQHCRTESNAAVAYKGMPPEGTEMEVVISPRGEAVNYGWESSPMVGPGEELRPD